MRGYVAVTDPFWFKFQKSRDHKRVLFWRHSSTPVKLNGGDYFFFLIRGKLPRLIEGYGIVEKADFGIIKRIWETHKDLTGHFCLQDLMLALGKKENREIAYYLLKDVEYIKDPTVTDADINFDRSIMAGRYLSQAELCFLKEALVNKPKT